MAESAKTSAVTSERFAAEQWNDYVRHSNNARESWRKHHDLIESIAKLEQEAAR